MIEDKAGDQIDMLISIAQIRTLEKFRGVLDEAAVAYINKIGISVVKEDKILSVIFNLNSPAEITTAMKEEVFRAIQKTEDWPTIEKLSKSGYNKGHLIAACLMRSKIRLCESIGQKMTEYDSRFESFTPWEWMLYIHQQFGMRIDSIVLKKEI